MTKEQFLKFLEETERKPYFSTLYDLDMWKEDKRNIERDLEVLEILKKYLKVSALENWGAYYLDTKDKPIRIDIEEYAKLKEWLDND